MSLFGRQEQRWRDPQDRSVDEESDEPRRFGDPGTIGFRESAGTASEAVISEAGPARDPEEPARAAAESVPPTLRTLGGEANAVSTEDGDDAVAGARPSTEGTTSTAQPELTPAPDAISQRVGRGALRPVTEGLRIALSDEHVWLTGRRGELETELANIEAAIEAEIGEVDGRLEHINALLGIESHAVAEAADDSTDPVELRQVG